MKTRTTTLLLVLMLAAWLPAMAQQKAVPQTTTPQVSGSTNADGHAKCACCPQEKATGKAMTCCQDKQMACCKKDGAKSSVTNCCTSKDGKQCARKDGKGCCGKDAMAKHCCAGGTCSAHAS